MTTRSEFAAHDDRPARVVDWPPRAGTAPASAVLSALAAKLDAASDIASDIRAGLSGGAGVEPIGVIFPLEQILRDALALQTAAAVLHLEPLLPTP